MKKITLVFALLLTFATIQISAQINDQATANLTVKLNPIQSITVSSPEVLINLTTPKDYKEGITKTVNNHLNVFSAGGYIVRVSSKETTNLENGNGNTLALNNISISADGAGALGTPVVLRKPAALGDAPILIKSATGTVSTDYNVNYIAAGNEANYVAAFDRAKPNLEFKVDVLYTIETN